MMSDLIKREDAIKAMEQRYQDILRVFKRKVKDGEKAIVLDMIGCIKTLPSADRPQGEWKSVKASIYPYGYDVECSVCGHRMGSSFGYKYCPMCGAHMKGADYGSR